MRVALCQINPVVGNLLSNTKLICHWIDKAQRQNRDIDLMVFPELALTGYPPTDHVFMDDFFLLQDQCLDRIQKASQGTHIILGMILKEGEKVFNAALWIDRKGQRQFQKKMLLPNRDVFDEKRYFVSGHTQDIWNIDDERIGLNICEDLWAPLFPEYNINPLDILIDQKPSLLINISASPFVAGKDEIRKNLVRHHVKNAKVPFLYLNLVGGNDDLIFDGASFAISAHGDLAHQAKHCQEDTLIFDTQEIPTCQSRYPESMVHQKKDALVLGLQDYVHKSGFKKVTLGLSGGIDSAVVAALAGEALGAQNVITVFMPTEFTRTISGEDAMAQAKKMGTLWLEIPIDASKDQLKQTLNSHFSEAVSTLTFENIQARLRGQILMAVSSEYRALVLQTGNKSEIALGYCTLYGDMVGGISPIGDLYKHEVYALGELLNQKNNVIPERVFDRPPSAELRADQKDTDTLPPYDVVDALVKAMVEDHQSVQSLIAQGFDPEIVGDIWQKMCSQEFKRKQAPIILKTSSKAFGRGRKMAIATQEVK